MPTLTNATTNPAAILNVRTPRERESSQHAHHTLASTLQTCINRGRGPSLHAKATHALVIKSPIDQTPYIYSKLLHFYTTTGLLTYARQVFDEMPERDLVAWTVLIGGHAHYGRFSEALGLFRAMLNLGFDYKPNSFSLSVALAACAALRAVRSGREIHGYMVRNMAEKDKCSESSLVDLYAKCGFLGEAREVFDGMDERDVVSWTIMIMGYANSDHGHEDEVLRLFSEMQYCDIDPNQHTLTVVLKSVNLGQGKQLHAQVFKRNWDSDTFVGSALIDLYAKNSVLNCAHLVFDRIPNKDVVCFNSLISGYGRGRCIRDVISIFEEMSLVGLVANQGTYVGMLNGCASMGSMCLGKQLHTQVITSGYDHDVIVQAVLVDMYAKCGSLEAACAAFDRMDGTKSLVAWNSMIGAYGKHGCGKDALLIFNSMEMASVRPDHITFTCLLSACSHSGLVEEGRRLFRLMGEVYGIEARNEHYCCMVDLLGRAGLMHEAYEFISRMKCEAGASIWGALLGACRVWGEAKLGEIAANNLFELEPDCAGSYVALANMFAAQSQWDGMVAIRELMDDRGVRKGPGCSWIEIDNEVHEFKAGDTLHHPSMKEIQSICRKLNSTVCDITMYFPLEL